MVLSPARALGKNVSTNEWHNPSHVQPVDLTERRMSLSPAWPLSSHRYISRSLHRGITGTLHLLLSREHSYSFTRNLRWLRYSLLDLCPLLLFQDSASRWPSCVGPTTHKAPCVHHRASTPGLPRLSSEVQNFCRLCPQGNNFLNFIPAAAMRPWRLNYCDYRGLVSQSLSGEPTPAVPSGQQHPDPHPCSRK